MTAYKKPPAIVTRVTNPLLIAAGTRLGIGPKGMAILEVTGRKTGNPVRIPLYPVIVGDEWFLFSPHGASQWVRNVRAAKGKARLWRHRKAVPVILTEIDDPVMKLDVARSYVANNYVTVNETMGIPRNPSDELLRAKLDDHPVFKVGKV